MTLLGVYLQNVSPTNSPGEYKGAAVKDFTPTNDTEKVEKQTLRPPDKFLNLKQTSSLLKETPNWMASKPKGKHRPENKIVQSFLELGQMTKKTEGTLMSGSVETATQVGKQSQMNDIEDVTTSDMTSDTSSEINNEQSSTVEKCLNSSKTLQDTVQQTETKKGQELFNLSGSGSDQSPKMQTIPTQNTENHDRKATQIKYIRATTPKSKERSSVETGLLSKSKSKNWFVAFYTQTQHQGMEAAINCGTRTKPCYYLKTVMTQLKEGDTVVLISNHTELISHQNESNNLNTDWAVQNTSESKFAINQNHSSLLIF